jgi:hypothetical protein
LARHIGLDGYNRRIELTIGRPDWETLSDKGEPIEENGKQLESAFVRFADDLSWRVEAAKAQRTKKTPPY